GIVFDAAGNLYVGFTPSTGLSQVLRYGPSSQAAFAVRLSIASGIPVTVQFATANGTAIDANDYLSTSGTVTFSPGQTTRTILVRTLDDTLYEGTESFFVNLSSAVGATITDAQGVATITDNEAPVLQVASTAVNSGQIQRSRVTEVTLTFNGLA